MESHSYAQQFLEDMAAWLRQQEQSGLSLSAGATRLFSSADVVWLHKMGISLRPDKR